jgi:hypothetical protein
VAVTVDDHDVRMAQQEPGQVLARFLLVQRG